MARRFPFPTFPKGWFQVAYSDELLPGKSLPLHYFGKELVLFRGQDGVARMLDAYCAHLGAHLGHGGVVEDNSIRCPFHGWRFDGCGTCVEVPYAKKIPPRARQAAHPLCEKNGMIMMWNDAEGGPPTFDIPSLSEYGSEEWTPYERRRWKVRTCNQEMAENSVDSAHFHYLHGTQNMPESEAVIDGPILRVKSTTGMSTPRGGVDGTVESTSYGFGFSTIRFRGIVETLLIGTNTAIDEEYVDLRFSFSVRRLGEVSLTRGVGKAFMAEVTRQLEQDIPIWEHKVYFERPLLCDGDGPIGIFRRWCRQFYGGAVTGAGTGAGAGAIPGQEAVLHGEGP